MLKAVLPGIELATISHLFSGNDINGFQYDKKEIEGCLRKRGNYLFDKWKKDKWLLPGDNTGMTSSGSDNYEWDTSLSLIFHTIFEPKVSLAANDSAGGELIWAVYMKGETIVLAERLEEEFVRICWVPTIPYALGSLYSMFKKRFRASDSLAGLNISLEDKNCYEYMMLNQLEDRKFLFISVDEEGSEDTLSFKEVYDRISLKIVKGHGSCIKDKISA